MRTTALVGALAVGALAAVVSQHHGTAEPAEAAAPPAARVAAPGDVSWPVAGKILDQGPFGACDGFAVSGLLGGDDTEAMRIYALATKIDEYPGSFPTKDTGTSAPAAMRAAEKLGLIKGFKTVHSASGALDALLRRPLVVEIKWDSKSNHTLVLLARSGGTVTFQNSWGASYGHHGLLTIPVSEFKSRFLRATYVSAS